MMTCITSCMLSRIESNPARRKRVQVCRGGQRRHHFCAIAVIAVVVFSRLGIADPVLDLNAPTLSHQSKKYVWGSPQAGYEPVNALELLADACNEDFTFAIQLAPFQFSLKWSGASYRFAEAFG